MRLTLLVAIFAVFTSILTTTGVALGECEKHPCVVMTAADVEVLKQNVESVEWMKNNFESLKKSVDEERERGLDIPAQGGLWSHYFICPNGSSLKYDPDSPHRHYCPDDGKYYEDPLMDGSWREMKHHRNFSAARDAAIIYAVTGEAEYAEFAREALVRYSKNYYKYPPHGGPAGLGRITGQSLNEAVLLIDAATAYDLVADAPCMSDRDREGITKKLFLPAAQHIEGHPFGVHNIQVWSDVAMLMAGLLANKKHFVDITVDDLRKQIDEGIRAEGLWHETSVGYHLYASRPFMFLAAVCRNAGLDVCAAPKLRKLFAVLENLAMPDLTLPSINDGGRGSGLAETARGAVVARYAFDDTSLDPMIAALGDEKSLASGHPYTTMYYRAPEGGFAEWQPPAKSSHMPDSGLSVLRRDGQYILIKYNPECRSHDHYDRLGIIYHDGHRELFPDLGTVPYSHPLYRGWFQRTEAHNTLMVNGLQQARVACKPISFYDEPDFTGVTVMCDSVYENVTMQRTLVLTGGVLVDFMLAQAEDENTVYDLFLRGNAPAPDVAPDPAIESPNDQIVFGSREEVSGNVTLEWPPLKEGQPAAYTTLVHFEPWGPTELCRGAATGFRADQKMPAIMWHRNFKSTIFCSITGPKSDEYALLAEGVELEVKIGGGRSVMITPQGDIRVVEKSVK